MQVYAGNAAGDERRVQGCKPCFYNRVYSFIKIQRKLQTEYKLHITFSEMMQKFQNKQC